jgi:hypothetical protein
MAAVPFDSLVEAMLLTCPRSGNRRLETLNMAMAAPENMKPKISFCI